MRRAPERFSGRLWRGAGGSTPQRPPMGLEPPCAVGGREHSRDQLVERRLLPAWQTEDAAHPAELDGRRPVAAGVHAATAFHTAFFSSFLGDGSIWPLSLSSRR